MSDTWSSIQAHKKQLDSLRERLQRRRKQDPLGAADPRHDLSLATPPRTSSPAPSGPDGGVSSLGSAPGSAPSPPVGGAEGVPGEPPEPDPALERRLLLHLSDLATPLPTDASAIRSAIAGGDAQVTLRAVESLLHKFAAQELIEVRRGLLHDGPALVTCADHSKLAAMAAAAASLAGRRRGAEPAGGAGGGAGEGKEAKRCRRAAAASDVDLEIESLLSQQSTKEQQSKKVSQEILELLNTTTAKEQSIVEKFRSRGRAQVQEFCDHGTKEECVKASGGDRPCRRLHFRRIINKHTDESLGDCSFLNTCFHMDTCKYVHYEIDACAATPPRSPAHPRPRPRSPPPAPPARGPAPDAGADRLFPPQWICCDIRYLDVSILGKFAVVMADPPWDIHMELPYGTLTDDEMRRLNIPVLQDEGFLFLWVTGRAMELGRECLNLWGYERVDEIIWVKTNQLQRIIRTGRTGHWLNHGKEHCLVGVKGNPQGFNRGLDCDVIVAEVRSTSHKPDEIYGMIERLSPGTRKIELFGRPHNVQPNWITLGNQLDGIHLLDPDVVAQFKQHYPDGVISKPKNI
ncbi:LOW QUALITY PROTEIN: N6-adenosine-methyltransferase catalytic subunit [Ammospiza caudacuta]|uniref:LOW QUALITY PROTEIN: N6-adenosine-methyltransferase catalytic subunit n=1 Tax=Ammospiza caudacuta TaxID=2857398 RepID=UPI002738482E|nr:LOW QUALITY PROTEIN: N6-adenosine-methyltransferase catalytic subunit [Ammospiza caudacuta]